MATLGVGLVPLATAASSACPGVVHARERYVHLSPNGDGHHDTAWVPFSLDEAAEVRVVVKPFEFSHADPVRKPVDLGRLTAGTTGGPSTGATARAVRWTAVATRSSCGPSIAPARTRPR
jgi:hypothetical protein